MRTTSTLRRTLALTVVLPLLAAGCDKDPFTLIERPDGEALSDGGSGGEAGGGVDDGDVADGRTDGGDGGVRVDGCVASEEVCDGEDNDCNGVVDDVASAKLKSDPNNCGGCGTACSFTNAFAKCDNGNCAMDGCAPGYFDNNSQASDGCEYQCLKTNGGVEECPQSEPACACDGADNDCDGQTDEVFDKTTDANNCGACGNRCLYNNAAASCVASACQMGACELGYKDLNTNSVDGCEYQCPIWPAVQEVCNGEDDDCDGEVDEGLPGAGEVCDTGLLGECQGGLTQCQGGTLKCVPQKSSSPETCDQLDNDCDGVVDDGFVLASDVLNCGTCGTICSFADAVPKCEAGVCKIDRCAGGYANLDGQLANGCEHKCEVTPTRAEVCNGKDDDCDTQVDEGFDLQSDIGNCGSCGNTCSYPNASAQCVSGTCAMGSCDANSYDVDKSDVNGCEYLCVKTNGGVEACDNVDNDCDGTIDNGFNLSADKNNCGTCGNVCVFNNAQAVCVAKSCVLATCDSGFKNIDKIGANGCEYKCPVWPAATTDGCDGVDNNCDGQVDELYTPTSCGTNTGECTAGTNACVGGSVVCQGAVGAKAETCDNLDNDCDGTVDNGFDKLNDPRYCGANCTACSLPHAIANCAAGVCGIAVCENGWVNKNGTVSDGCEYNCTVTGVEICDGIDNDCDGGVDEGVTLGGNPCIAVSGTPCAGTTATCQGTQGWVCNYPATVQLRSCSTDADCDNLVTCTGGVCPGIVASDENLCDGADNDCDTQVDETFSNKGTGCVESGKQGICQGSGSYTCTADKSATECTITTPGATATNELCNGKDDDCDGLVDEETDDAGGLGVVDAMVKVGSIWVYAYEASRPDALAGSAGSSGARACSRPGVRPWANVTYAEALAACQAAGKRLCTAAEWQAACGGSSPQTTYPYGNAYSGSACNGLDNGVGGVLDTGAESACVGGYPGLFDLSGNVREWTDDQAGTTGGGTAIYVVRGGGYSTPKPGLHCAFTFSQAVADVVLPSIGFRCCSDTVP